MAVASKLAVKFQRNQPEKNANENTNESEELLDGIIERVMNAPMESKKDARYAPEVDAYIKPDEIKLVTTMAIEALKVQNSLVRIPAKQLPAMVVGDIHGQLTDLRHMLRRCGDPAKQTYVFLGDYVDRGRQGLEVAILLLALRVRHPKTVILLRGNHEDCNTTTTYGFYDECVDKYEALGEMVWLHLVCAFNHLPLCALLDGKILCMHGGLSPSIQSLHDIEELPRPSIVPPYGLMCDLLWADPEHSTMKGYSLSSRGISFSFDESVVSNFCAKHKVALVIRAHQITTEMIRGGYKTFCGGKLITIFSAANYLGLQNDAAVLKISQNLQVRMLVFRPRRVETVGKKKK